MRFMAMALVLLAGCAATPDADLTAARASWSGASYEEVVSRWGTPVRSTQLAQGRVAHTWVSESVTTRAALWPSIGIFGGSGGVGFGTGVTIGPGGGALVRCERTLVFENGRVVNQTWHGSEDYCSQFARG